MHILADTAVQLSLFVAAVGILITRHNLQGLTDRQVHRGLPYWCLWLCRQVPALCGAEGAGQCGAQKATVVPSMLYACICINYSTTQQLDAAGLLRLGTSRLGLVLVARASSSSQYV